MKLNELIKKAQGERTQNQYALHCSVGSSTITRFLKGERSPTPDILKKLAEKAYNGVTYDDFMRAAYGTTSTPQKSDLENPVDQKMEHATPQISSSPEKSDIELIYESLNPRQQERLLSYAQGLLEANDTNLEELKKHQSK